MAERKGIYFVDEPINTVGIGKTPDYVNVLSESPRYYSAVYGGSDYCGGSALIGIEIGGQS